jgi:predicted permease
LRGTFRHHDEDTDFTAELESHLQLQIDDNVRSGMAPEEARRQALIKFGSMTSLQECYREQLGFPLVESLLNDLRFNLHMMAKAPGLTVIVVLTLALGIGVNLAIFSVLNGWLFRPLPVSHPEELMVIAPFRQQGPNAKMSCADFKDYEQQSDSFSGMLAYSMGAAGLSVDGTPHELVYSSVTGNFFSILGVQPALGRFFLPDEGEHSGDGLQVVLGYAYWKKHFDGNPSVLGKQVQVNGSSATVIGVAPSSFHGLLFAFDMDGYLPLSFMSRTPDGHDFYSNRSNRGLNVLGRLKPNLSTERARTSLNVIANRLAAQYPDSNSGYTIRVIPERLSRPAPLVASFAPAIATLFLGLASIVLLIACTNVAGLLLARGSGHQRETAIRAALGAKRWRPVCLALSESFLLTPLGGIAGVVLGKGAIAASEYLLHSVTTTANFGYRIDCSFDWKVFAYTFTIVIFTGFFVALWPALRAGRTDINALLHKDGSSGHFSRQRFRTISAVTQLAGCVMLLIVSGLFVRTLRHAGFH